MSLDCERKLKYLEKTHVVTWRTCKLMAQPLGAIRGYVDWRSWGLNH